MDGTDNFAYRLLLRMHLPPDTLVEELRLQLPHFSQKYAMETRVSPLGRRVLSLAYEEALYLRDGHIGTEHLLLGLLREKVGLAGHTLREKGLDVYQVRQAIRDIESLKETLMRPSQCPGVAPDELLRAVLESEGVHPAESLCASSAPEEAESARPQTLWQRVMYIFRYPQS